MAQSFLANVVNYLPDVEKREYIPDNGLRGFSHSSPKTLKKRKTNPLSVSKADVFNPIANSISNGSRFSSFKYALKKKILRGEVNILE